MSAPEESNSAMNQLCYQAKFSTLSSSSSPEPRSDTTSQDPSDHNEPISDESPNKIMASKDGANMARMHIPPGQWRYARACMVCSIVMTQAHFRADGCPNCPFLDLKGSPEAIETCTSSQFEGTMAIFKPQSSWVAKWQRIQELVPGTYAVKVNGTLPEDASKDGELAGPAVDQDGDLAMTDRPDKGKGKGKAAVQTQAPQSQQPAQGQAAATQAGPATEGSQPAKKGRAVPVEKGPGGR
ncbi:Spt4/RpoE2 zinc finger-domain-containing protein [Hypoxylon sp. FL1857]|nr:Spt4/RpoE2 zinc finger-domain-containing protein [Hypoxylon sp. FL1857]